MSGIARRIIRLKNGRKRLRGMRRHLRDHQRRAAVAQLLPLSELQQQQRAYRKLGVTPWAVSEKPPLAFRQLWVSRLVADFAQWQAELANHYPAFYLAVWLFEPHFGESQLVASVGEALDFYDNAFGEPTGQPLPAAYLALPGVAALRWTARAQLAAYWLDEFADLPARQR